MVLFNFDFLTSSQVRGNTLLDWVLPLKTMTDDFSILYVISMLNR